MNIRGKWGQIHKYSHFFVAFQMMMTGILQEFKDKHHHMSPPAENACRLTALSGFSKMSLSMHP